MFKVAILVSCLALAYAAGISYTQQRQTDSEGSLGPENLPYIAPPPAPAPEPAGAGPNLDELYGPPKPYQFGYDAAGSDGRSSRSESSDGRKVTGSYTLVGADGINRVVHYVADGDGFRASIITNEPGTENQNPSGVIMETSQPKAEEIARALGPVAEPGPDAPRQYIGAPIPAMPSVGSYRAQPRPSFPQQPDISQGSAGPAFDAPQDQQQRQQPDSFEDEQQQQQRLSAPFPAPAPLPATPQPIKSNFAQRIVHSVPQAPITQQAQLSIPQAPLPAPQPIAQAPLPVPQAPAAPIRVFRPVQISAPQRFAVSDYQPVIAQEIPRIAPLQARPVFFQQQLQHQQTFAPLPAPRPVQIAQAPLPAPAPIQAQLPLPAPQQFTFTQTAGSASQGVKSAVRAGSTKSAALAAPGATKSRFIAPSRTFFAPLRVQAPLPVPAAPAPTQVFLPAQPIQQAQASFLASSSQGKTSLPSAPAPIKSAALSAPSGKANGQRVLRPFYLTTTTTLAPLPARFEQSRNEQADVSAASSGFLSQVKDEQQKDAEDQYFKS